MASAIDHCAGPQTFRLALVGDGGVGKSTFIKCLVGELFADKYEPTTGKQVYDFELHTNRGIIKFLVWDTVGQEKFGTLTNSDMAAEQTCAIIIFDLGSRITLKNVSNWNRDLLKSCGDIPVVLCGTKVDVKDKKVNASNLKKYLRKYTYFNISAKAQYNVVEPFIAIAKQLLGDDDLKIVEMPAMAPPPIQIDARQLVQFEQELKDAQQHSLPSDEDDF